MPKYQITIPVSFIVESNSTDHNEVALEVQRALGDGDDSFTLDDKDWFTKGDVAVELIAVPFPELGVTILEVGDVEVLHNTIASAVGEPQLKE